jgi:hypothetical protein
MGRCNSTADVLGMRADSVFHNATDFMLIWRFHGFGAPPYTTMSRAACSNCCYTVVRKIDFLLSSTSFTKKVPAASIIARLPKFPLVSVRPRSEPARRHFMQRLPVFLVALPLHLRVDLIKRPFVELMLLGRKTIQALHFFLVYDLRTRVSSSFLLTLSYVKGKDT